MGRNILRSPRARLDLIEIWQFIADDKETAADRLLDRVDAALTMLRDNPLAGRARPELATDLRSFPIGSHVLYYRPVKDDGIELIRVLSGYLDVQPEDMN